jgi:hypothetical protein
MASDKLNELKEIGVVPTPQEVEAEMNAQIEMLSKKPDLFIKLTRKIVADQLDSIFYINNEDLDTSVTVNNLISMLKIAPQYSDATVKQIYDLMGLDMPKANSAPQQAPQEQVEPQGQPQMQTPGSLQGLMTKANTM